MKKKHPELYQNPEDLSFSPDQVINFQERILVPPTLRHEMLKYLHCNHMGRDKMLSNARSLCWWPNLNQDISFILKDCEKCSIKPNKSSLSPWPFSIKPMQRVHIDYCGPFIENINALIIIDSYSRYPEIFFTKCTDAQFTKTALRKFFAREGVPQVIVSDNGPQFRSEYLRTWLESIGTQQIFTPPRHPQSNGQAENFVRRFKNCVTAIQPSTANELYEITDLFLLQYRASTHSTTQQTPALLFKGRELRTGAAMDTEQ